MPQNQCVYRVLGHQQYIVVLPPGAESLGSQDAWNLSGWSVVCCCFFVFVVLLLFALFATLLLNLLIKLYKEKPNADFWDSMWGTYNSLRRLWAQRTRTKEPVLQRIQPRDKVSGLIWGQKEEKYCSCTLRLWGTFSHSKSIAKSGRREAQNLRREELAKESSWYSSPGGPAIWYRSCLAQWEYCNLRKNLVCHLWFSTINFKGDNEFERERWEKLEG